MSLHRIGGQSPQSLLRDLATQAAAHPKIEQAVLGGIRAVLPDVIEELLRAAYGGERVRLYVASRSSRDAKADRDRRIAALASAPSNLSPAAIAAQEGLSLRRVQQILRKIGA